MPLPFFPLVLSLIGVYLIYRGWSVKGSQMDVLTGTVSSQLPLTSLISKVPCVLSVLKLEYLEPKSEDWKKLAMTMDVVSFSVDGRSVNPSKADVYLGDPKTWIGHLKCEKGAVEQFSESAHKSQPVQILTNLASQLPFSTLLGSGPSENQFLPDDVVKSLRTLPEFSKYLDKYKKYSLRISEDVVSIGAKVDVLGDPTQNLSAADAGALKALVVSTKGSDIVRSAVVEKAKLSMIAGGGLIIIALLLFVFLI